MREQAGSLESLRELNRSRVVNVLRDLGVASRADIARRTGLSPSTVSSLVAELHEAGVIVDRDGAPDADGGRGGRPPRLIALDRSAGVSVGIDFGKRHLAVAVSDLSHEILAEAWREMPDDYDFAKGMDAAEALVRDVLVRLKIKPKQVIGVGVGLPGPIHQPTGTVGSATILPGWRGVRVGEEMQRRLALPVRVDNDANLGALAELHWGAGRGCSNLAYIKVATGIGSGLVIGGRLFRGTGGTAGEIGHTTIDDSGPICRCGSRGCLEAYAAAPAILELLRSSLGEELTAEQLIERTTAGDLACRRAIADAGRHLGSALANLCNVLNPERIVVGGSFGAVGDVLLAPMREAVGRRAISTAAEDVEIVPGVLGERAELLGAVALVLYEAEVSSLPLEVSGR